LKKEKRGEVMEKVKNITQNGKIKLFFKQREPIYSKIGNILSIYGKVPLLQ